MHHDETVAAVARKLYRYSKKDVAEVLEVLIEVWSEHLMQPDATLYIRGLGRLRIDEQEVLTNIAVQRILESQGKPVPETLKRYYFRFYPTDAYKQQLVEFRKVQEEQHNE